MNKPYLPLKVRKVLELRGVIKLPTQPAPRMPKLDDLIEQAGKKGFGAHVEVPVPDEDAEPADQLSRAVVTDFAGESWTVEDAHPGVALATALADALVATEATQALLFGQAAD